MRRILALAVAVAALATAGAAAADGPRASAAGFSQLTAHNVFGLQTLELQVFAFRARLDEDGEAEGWFVYRILEDGVPFAAAGPVTCMTVIGRGAWLGGPIRHSSDPSVVGQFGWWHVTDNAGTAPDVTSFLGIGSLAATQAFCANHPPYKFPFAIDRGDIRVRG